jgi:hypothetical protein
MLRLAVHACHQAPVDHCLQHLRIRTIGESNPLSGLVIFYGKVKPWYEPW